MRCKWYIAVVMITALTFGACHDRSQISVQSLQTIVALGHGGMGISSSYPLNSAEGIKKCLALGLVCWSLFTMWIWPMSPNSMDEFMRRHGNKSNQPFTKALCGAIVCWCHWMICSVELKNPNSFTSPLIVSCIR